MTRIWEKNPFWICWMRNSLRKATPRRTNMALSARYRNEIVEKFEFHLIHPWLCRDSFCCLVACCALTVQSVRAVFCAKVVFFNSCSSQDRSHCYSWRSKNVSHIKGFSSGGISLEWWFTSENVIDLFMLWGARTLRLSVRIKLVCSVHICNVTSISCQGGLWLRLSRRG